MLIHAEVYNGLADKKSVVKVQGLSTVHQCFLSEFCLQRIVMYCNK